MIRINLLPVRQTRKLEAFRRELTIAGAVGVLIVGFLMFVYVIAQVQARSVGNENKVIQAEIAKLQEDVNRVDEMEKFKQELQRKLAVIADLRSRKTGPVHMLDDLSTATPEKLLLTKLTQSAANVTIEGGAVSNEVISQFLRSLDSSEYFDQVYLVDIEAKQTKADAGITLKNFKLTAHLSHMSPTDETKDGKDAKGKDAKGKDAPAGDKPAGAAPAGATPAPAPEKPATGGGA